MDDFGNRSAVDSVVYVIDTRIPRMKIEPSDGAFAKPVTVTVQTDEPSFVFTHSSPDDSGGTPVQGSFTVNDTFVGYVSAVDSAGNRATSSQLRYIVTSPTATISIDPPGGTFNGRVRFRLSADKPYELFYTFDPQAIPDRFTKYVRPTRVPPGRTIVRYYGVDENGLQTDIERAVFMVDTVGPSLRARRSPGPRYDTVYFDARGADRIHYEIGRHLPNDESPVYDGPITVRREGIGLIRAFAVDAAGNRSKMVTWEHRYDLTAPTLSLSPNGGQFSRSVRVKLSTNEPANIYYTLDGALPDTGAVKYNGNLLISRQGETVVRAVAIDEAGNMSTERKASFVLDTVAPHVTSRIQGRPGDSAFVVELSADEEARIHYSRGGASPSRSSPTYSEPIRLRAGQRLRYFAVDRAGNRSREYIVDDLAEPMVGAKPPGGRYNYPVDITFAVTGAQRVYWRLLPDTAFVPYADTIHLRESGVFTIEYYAGGEGGAPSAIRREEYTIDLVAPHVRVSLKPGPGDTAYVLFEANENATVYYTLDGSSPYNSPTVRSAGNKLLSSTDRVKVVRKGDLRLAYYAEDAAGNQSRLSVIDLFKPRPIPSLPAGPDIVYDRVLTISLNTYDKGRIYYARHGHTPTVDSSVYTRPITLTKSDTICAFVVSQSGAVGDIDTLIFLIDLPPRAAFEVKPNADSLAAGMPVQFDASVSEDRESPISQLRFRWEFDGDGEFDTPFANTPTVTHTYEEPGYFAVTLEVEDGRKRTSTFNRRVLIRGNCPSGMVYAVDTTGHGFCIDKYEWPNRPGEKPLTNVSWVEAKMRCYDSGKRLCTAAEWEAACRGNSITSYPYGENYESSRCATEGESAFTSGTFESCKEGFGTRDMVGNVWEWVEDKHRGAPLQMGGAYGHKQLAHCGLNTEQRMSTRANDVGFRCCK